MRTVLVFKTSVANDRHIRRLAPNLNWLVNKNGQWNFDLEDCDNILRVETQSPDSKAIANLLVGKGFFCEELF